MTQDATQQQVYPGDRYAWAASAQGLSTAEKAVLIALAMEAHSIEWTVRLARPALMERTSLSEASVRRALATLEQRNLIETLEWAGGSSIPTRRVRLDADPNTGGQCDPVTAGAGGQPDPVRESAGGQCDPVTAAQGVTVTPILGKTGNTPPPQSPLVWESEPERATRGGGGEIDAEIQTPRPAGLNPGPDPQAALESHDPAEGERLLRTEAGLHRGPTIRRLAREYPPDVIREAIRLARESDRRCRVEGVKPQGLVVERLREGDAARSLHERQARQRANAARAEQAIAERRRQHAEREQRRIELAQAHEIVRRASDDELAEAADLMRHRAQGDGTLDYLDRRITEMGVRAAVGGGRESWLFVAHTAGALAEVRRRRAEALGHVEMRLAAQEVTA